jgi:hypothetical protein
MKQKGNKEIKEEKEPFDLDLILKQKRLKLGELKISLSKHSDPSEEEKKTYTTLKEMSLNENKCSCCGGRGHAFFNCGSKKKLDDVFSLFPHLKEQWGKEKLQEYINIEEASIKKLTKGDSQANANK